MQSKDYKFRTKSVGESNQCKEKDEDKIKEYKMHPVTIQYTF